MTRSRALLAARAAVALAITVSGWLFMARPATAASDDASTPLRISLDSVTPAAIPRTGPIRITGTITNTSTQTWRSISLYPLTSATPFTTTTQLRQADATDPDTVIGDRIVADGHRIDDLVPDQTRPFTLMLRHRDLVSRISGAPGVYWLGVHALGSGDTSGSDNLADGRARTFLPLVPARASRNPVPVSLVVPLRHIVRRGVDGTITNPGKWSQDIAPSGPLGKVLGFANTAGNAPFTWLVDPAVLAALNDLASGDPGLQLGRAGDDTDSTPSASASPSQGTDAGGEDSGAPNAAADAFKTWLRGWTASAHREDVLALPYADPDVSAIGVDHLNVLQQAWKSAASVLGAMSISAGRAIAPLDGYLDPRTVAPQAPGTTVLVGGAGGRTGVWNSRGVRYARTDALVDAPDAGTGSAIDLRQRILSETAIRSLTRDRSPVVVVLSTAAAATAATAGTAGDRSFFAPFEALPWVRLATLPPGRSIDQLRLPWPARARAAMLPAANAAAASQLISTAATATSLFEDDGEIGTRLARMALAAISQQARAHPARARDAVDAADTAMRVLFNDIVVEGTDFVTLSGDNGNLTVSLFNGLDKTVRVGLSARADDPKLRLSAPTTIQLAAGRRSTVRIATHARTVGVHEVRLTPITTSGTPVGRPFVFSVRTSQIGQVFWYVVLGGAGIVALMIIRRARLRIRARRAQG